MIESRLTRRVHAEAAHTSVGPFARLDLLFVYPFVAKKFTTEHAEIAEMEKEPRLALRSRQLLPALLYLLRPCSRLRSQQLIFYRDQTGELISRAVE